MDGLIIKKRHLDQILTGQKTWEIRGSNTKKRDTIALIEAGTGFIVGTCNIVDSKPLTDDDIEQNGDKHQLSKTDLFFFQYKNPHAWKLKNAKRITPVKYNHPKGAQIWVKNVLPRPQRRNDGKI